MITKVQKHISEHKLLTERSKIMVGLSGGPDSMALIHILMELGYKCIAAHCNFHLRGEDSNNDALFVQNWCKAHNIPFFSIDCDTYSYATQKNISIEMAARELRYNWFEELRIEQKCDAIAIGHHRDDSVETILINLIRGTGIKGLTGIPVRNKQIVRPLLSVSRIEIIKYLSAKNIPYVVDQTNEEDIYTRNTLRLKVLPILQTINPSVKNSILKSSANLKEVEKIYDQFIKNSIEDVLVDNKIDIEKLKSTASHQSVLFEILSPLGFTSSVIEDVSDNLDSIPGKIYLSKEFKILKDRDYLLISQINDEETSDEEFLIYPDSVKGNTPFSLSLKTEEYNSEYIIQKDHSVLQVDFDKLTFPLILRKWRKGDWFIPFGMKGRKKLSDFFTDNKFNLFQKGETWVVCSGNDIVWIVNYRVDDRFKITDQTKKVYSIKTLK